MAFSILLFFLTILLLPADAYAWGVGVHLQLGSHILSNLSILAPALQTLLTAYPNDYLYGCMSADITLGKKHTHYLNHCHSWRMGKKVLEAAKSDSQLACAYGYLSHLAADTVAHSYFVPFKMVRTFNTILLKHAYWELRLEAKVDPAIWELARTVARKNFQDNDRMLRSVLSDQMGASRRISRGISRLGPRGDGKHPGPRRGKSLLESRPDGRTGPACRQNDPQKPQPALA